MTEGLVIPAETKRNAEISLIKAIKSVRRIMKTILEIIRKEFIQFKRDPKMRMIVLVAPIIQLIFLGYAANMDVEKVHIALYDQDKSVTSRKLIEDFTAVEIFNYDYAAEDYDEVTELLNEAKIICAIVIPNNFEKEIEQKRTAEVQLLFDGSDGNTASISAGYIQNVLNRFNQKMMEENFAKIGLKLKPVNNINIETRFWYNQELKTRNYMVPAIFGLLLMIVTSLLTSLAVVKEKEIGTLEQLIVTPIKPYQLIVGKLVPFFILGIISIILALGAMFIVFGIVVRGSFLFLFLSSFVFILSTLGLGLFVSTISKTQQQAMMIAIFVVMMPMVYLSGFAFPIENMPDIIQLITYTIPLRYFITIIRGVILKGIGFTELWPQLTILFLMGITILTMSTLRFKKRLE